ncbi:MAG: ArsR family transcriptional regulator [Limisphaerales bacterium]|nr:MAG: ArsR family transcriptional regulator [Limisphaerales bacterium]KAG0506722.1 MAG: ArsR family transcriptional regulator [Limisphaerales bacterium]TXT51706.1 MAG: ArsR family transcriptional regulator [Limisphaerales bacterium]
MPNQAKTARGLPAEALELVAARFRVLGEPNRLRLISALEQGEKNVSELVAETELTQANVSRHLQTLTEAGLLGRRKEGLNVFYFIADESLFKLCDLVCSRLQKELAAKAASLKG